MERGPNKRRRDMGERAWKLYQSRRQVIKSQRWKKKNPVSKWRRRTKQYLIGLLGGKCIRCGYSKPCLSAYHFHHTDPKEKDFGLSGKCWSLGRLETEARKCILLCANCHAEIHDVSSEVA